MTRTSIAFLTSTAIAGLLMVGVARDKPSQDELIAEGKALYEQYCLTCHGAAGAGDGEMAYLSHPKPRDLTEGVYKVRSTQSGSVPTDDDLYRVISNGMPGTSMPAWKGDLTNRQRWALAQYVKSLSPRFATERPEGALRVSAIPATTDSMLQLGKRIYAAQGCGQCHGATGKGDGPSARTLRDAKGYPIVPYDFTQSARFKGGSAPRDIYRTFMTGMDGTPMPSYAGTLTDKESWALTHYVLSLVSKEPAIPDFGHEIVAARVSRLPDIAAPMDSLWSGSRASIIPVRPLWDRPGAVDRVQAKALHDGRTLQIYLTWKEQNPSDGYARVQEFRDAVAVQFPVMQATGTKAFYGMGDAQNAVNVWMWRADWQADLARFRDLFALYPNIAVDWYPFVTDPTFVPALRRGNLNATTLRLTSVEDLNATGPSSITSQIASKQNVHGFGAWYEGAWHVVIQRDLRTSDAEDAQLAPGAETPIAFGVWQGAQGDRNGQKSISIWQTLRLEP